MEFRFLRKSCIKNAIFCTAIFVFLAGSCYVIKSEVFDVKHEENKNFLRVEEPVHKLGHKRVVRNAPERKLLSQNLQELRENLYSENYMEKPRQTTLNDVFISVKTSSKFHGTRLPVILKTWWTKAKSQVYFFTDSDDGRLQNKTFGHMRNTKCQSSHNRRDLSCKMGAEYDAFMESNKRWWCHFDDDNYLNVEQLVLLLNNYDSDSLVYLGKPSLGHSFATKFEGKDYSFWFGTGGAGICLSRASGDKIAPWARSGAFVETAEALKLPDDVTLGFIVSGLAKIELTHVRGFHSHLEQLSAIHHRDLADQITLSYHNGQTNGDLNTVELDKRKAAFKSSEDPTRFMALHCLIYPYTDWCR